MGKTKASWTLTISFAEPLKGGILPISKLIKIGFYIFSSSIPMPQLEVQITQEALIPFQFTVELFNLK